MLNAMGTFLSVSPDSSVNEGMMAICWPGMREANGFSGCPETFSVGFSAKTEQGKFKLTKSHFSHPCLSYLCPQVRCRRQEHQRLSGDLKYINDGNLGQESKKI